MKLIFIYGPPAVGKLTVAKALAKRTGFAVADNHSLINAIAAVFGWDHPERSRLADLFRVELFQAAAMADRSVITTTGRGGKTADAFIKTIKQAVEAAGGDMLFVHLIAPVDILLERVRHISRLHHGKMTTPEELKQKLTDSDVFARALVQPHLEIDATNHTAEDMADMIVKYYGL